MNTVKTLKETEDKTDDVSNEEIKNLLYSLHGLHLDESQERKSLFQEVQDIKEITKRIEGESKEETQKTRTFLREIIDHNITTMVEEITQIVHKKQHNIARTAILLCLSIAMGTAMGFALHFIPGFGLYDAHTNILTKCENLKRQNILLHKYMAINKEKQREKTTPT